VAVIGDGTFFHSGITGLIDAVYNKSNVTVVILDNSATVMTGGQQHPATGDTLMGDKTNVIDIPTLCKSLGVKSVRVVDPYNYQECLDSVKDEIEKNETSVIITNRPCVLMPERIMDEPYVVDLDLCNGCSACFRISCPAIMASEETNEHGSPKALIDETLCTGCSLCTQVCKPDAIVLKSQFAKEFVIAMADMNFNILIVGVGGQGVLLASELISEVAIQSGLDVKKSEVHGMSQRGGVVSSHVKIAPKVYSPTIQYGQADVVLSFEKAEGLRAIDWMKRDGVAIVSTTALVPAIVTSSKNLSYPHDAVDRMKEKTGKVIALEADDIALELGNPRLVNTILLGVMSNYLPFDLDMWNQAIKDKVKAKFVDVNLKAFERGRSITE